MNKINTYKKAFSLAEMMVVMLILSIVMAASMPIITRRARVHRDNDSIPYGVIVIWHGNTGSIPDGWHLCDGTNGTPDLRSRFVYGAGSDTDTKPSWVSEWNGTINTEPAASGHFSPLIHGGEEQHVLSISEMTQHNHTASAGNQSIDHTHSGTTSSAGSHNHSEMINGRDATAEGGYVNGTAYGRSAFDSGLKTSSDGAHTHTFTTGGVSADHTHAITVNNNGSGTAHNIMPRFMVLAYIMKTS